MLRPPVNVLRLSLHPDGLASRIANLGQWRAHILHRLRQQVAASADPILAALLTELAGYPAPDGAGDEGRHRDLDETGVVIPLRLRTEEGLLAFFSTITIFGTPVDVTLSELAVEAFFPADAATAAALGRAAGGEAGAPASDR